MMSKEEIAQRAAEDRILSHLQKDELAPAGFDRIKRQRPNNRPAATDRRREDTRRRPRDGKW